LLEITELTIGMRRLGMATYARERGGVIFKRMLMYETREKVYTDRLLVSDEAVRVLDVRE